MTPTAPSCAKKSARSKIKNSRHLRSPEFPFKQRDKLHKITRRDLIFVPRVRSNWGEPAASCWTPVVAGVDPLRSFTSDGYRADKVPVNPDLDRARCRARSLVRIERQCIAATTVRTTTAGPGFTSPGYSSCGERATRSLLHVLHAR